MTLKIREDVTYLLELADALQKEATKENIISVFDDGGFRELLLTKMFGLKKMAGRHGDDGLDEETGKHYELKTVNLIDTKGELRFRPGVTTCHHVNEEIITRYRAVSGFLVGIFYINEPVRIYEVPTEALEPYFSAWENRLRTEAGLKHINNPKISFNDILNNGVLHYHDKRYDEYFKTLEENNVIKKARKKQLAETLRKINMAGPKIMAVKEIQQEHDQSSILDLFEQSKLGKKVYKQLSLLDDES